VDIILGVNTKRQIINVKQIKNEKTRKTYRKRH
jgi:hypothetical protein